MSCSWYVRRNRGIAALQTNQIEEALAHLSKSIFLSPSEPIGYLCRGEAYLKLCDFQSALRNYRKAFRLDPGNHTTQSRLATIYFFIGKIQQDSQQLDLAAMSFSEALALDKFNPTLWIELINNHIHRCARTDIDARVYKRVYLLHGNTSRKAWMHTNKQTNKQTTTRFNK